MKDFAFAIGGISPLLRDMDKEFGVADINMRLVSNDGADRNNLLTMTLLFAYDEAESMSALRARAYEEAKQTLRRAADLLEKHDIESIYTVAPEDV